MNPLARDEIARVLTEQLDDPPLARQLADAVVRDIDWTEVDR